MSLRSAWLISRAWMPTKLSPISPSISARGTRAATESSDDDVHAAGPDQGLGDLERLLAGVRLADEELVHVDAAGARVARVQRVLDVDERRDAASRCASAMTCWQTVVLPDDSGPKISVIRPRGMPPTPRARSSAIEPVGIESTYCRSAEPSFMIDPRPNCFSIARIAASTARPRSATALSVPSCRCGRPGPCR